MNTKAKPFIKWVGGKGQLIEQLEAKLPADFDNWDDATYIEPFVGGGYVVLHAATASKYQPCCDQRYQQRFGYML